MYDSRSTQNMKKTGEHFGFVRKFEIILNDTPNTMYELYLYLKNVRP